MMYSIHQPSYFPWLGLLHKIIKSDQLIVLDKVQLSDSAYQNRNIFLAKNGVQKILTIPIERKDYLEKVISDLKVADAYWGKKHKNFIKENYSKHPYFDEVYPFLEPVLNNNSLYLCDIVLQSMHVCLDMLDSKTEVLLQSDIKYNADAKKGDLVIELLRSVRADSYLSGHGAKAYQDEVDFTNSNIDLRYSNFKIMPYPQKGADAFVPGLSSLDLFFNIGLKDAVDFMGKCHD